MKMPNINFSYFINQELTTIENGTPFPLRFTFTDGGMCVECSWRIRRKGRIMVGHHDFHHARSRKEALQQLKDLLVAQRIKGVSLHEEFDLLCVQFSNDCVLEVFQDSYCFEGWELFGANDFSVIGLPGGGYEAYRGEHLCED